MGLAATIDSKTYSFNKKVRSWLVTYTEYKNIRKKKSLIEKVKLTKVQEDEINAFFKEHYGRTVPLHWHRLYQSYTGVYRKDYFPEILFSTKLEPMLNPYREAELLGDKNLLPLLFCDEENLRVPVTYASCLKGRCRDKKNVVVDYHTLCDNIANIGACVVKKTTETSSGRDVQLCNFINGKDTKTGKSEKEILAEFGKNFVVQEKIEQHDSIANLNPTSVNTFRIITYIYDSKVYCCPIALRLGRSNADRDNIHYGGICVGVDRKGVLKPYAFSEFGEVTEAHPDTHVKFNQYVVGGGKFETVIDAVIRAHGRIAHLGILSWDIALDCNGNGVIIEVNTTGQSAWFCQMVNGEPLFGENTGRMLELIKKKR